MKSGTSTREKLKDPPQTHEVGSLKQAVALAQHFKDVGKYDWFRGQVAPWVPHSSLFRRFIMEDKSEHDHAIWRRDRLMAWARQIPELSHTLNSKNLYELLAIAQHHGIPTNLIDFTTDPAVAGFFSADTDKPHIATPRKETSCIYCLHTKRLEKVWAHVSATRSVQGAHIETIRVNIGNLWRLQSQRGVFLHANYYWEADYPMDRILFPYTGYPDVPPRSQIYPVDKSPLEQLLDQYFEREIVEGFGPPVAEFIKQGQKQGHKSTITLITTSRSASGQSVFKEGAQVAQLPSWDPKTLAEWYRSVIEDYHETVGGVRVVELRDAGGPAEWRRSTRCGVKRILNAEPGLRAKAVTWQIRGLPESVPHDNLENSLRLLWNGMRRLPYTDNEIAESAASVVALIAGGFHGRASDSTRKRVFANTFEEPFLAGFAAEDGSGAHGYASCGALRAGLRSDMSDILVYTYRDLTELFGIIDDPKFMFEFPSLRERFAREIIPSQVAIERSLTLFNPAKLTMFGNP